MDKGFVGIILFLGSLALALGLLKPAYEEFLSLKDQKENLQVQLATKEEYINELKRVLSSLAQDPSYVARLDTALPNSPDISKIIYALHLFSVQSGVELLNLSQITISQVSPKVVGADQQGSFSKNLKMITMSLELKGSYRGLRSFLEKLQNSIRLFEIESFSLVRAQAKFGFEVSPALNLSLRLKVPTY